MPHSRFDVPRRCPVPQRTRLIKSQFASRSATARPDHDVLIKPPAITGRRRAHSRLDMAHIAGPMQPEVVAPEWMFCCAVRIAVTAPAQQAAWPTVIMLAVQQRPLRKGRLLDPVATAGADCLRPPCLSPGLISASVGGRVRRV